MSQNNDYPLTQPSQELTNDLTAALKLPHYPALEEHLRTCQQCYQHDGGMCTTAKEMVGEVDFLSHRDHCAQCRETTTMCARGWAIFHG